MHAHQQNAFNAWWSQEHGTIDSQTGLVDALARAYGRAIWSAAVDAATHLPEAGKMVGDAEALPPQAVHPKDDPAALWATIWRLRAELEAAQAVPAEPVGHVKYRGDFRRLAVDWRDGIELPDGAALYLAPPAPTPPAEATAPSGAASDDEKAALLDRVAGYERQIASQTQTMFRLQQLLEAAGTTPPQAPPAPPALTDAECDSLTEAIADSYQEYASDDCIRESDWLRTGRKLIRAALNGGQASSATPPEQQGGE